MDNGIQPVMNVGSGCGYGDGYGFGGNGLWLFAILALMWGGFGGNRFGNAFGERCATVEDLNNSANFTRLESHVMNNGNAIRQESEYIVNGISQLGYQNARDFGALSQQVANCCCDVLRANDQTRFDMANYTASINANTTAGVQKILDKLCQDKTEALQTRVSQLELQSALCGVVRYPNNATFAVGTPFNFGCGCNPCCQNNI